MIPSRSSARHLLGVLNDWLAQGARYLVVALSVAMVLAIAWQVLTRVTVNRSPPWTEEIALLMFSWIVLLMIAIGVREHLHVRVDGPLSLLPQTLATAAERLITVFIACIGCYLVWSGTGYLVSMRGSTSQAIRYPYELLYSALPVAATLMVTFALENLFREGALQKSDAP